MYGLYWDSANKIYIIFIRQSVQVDIIVEKDVHFLIFVYITWCYLIVIGPVLYITCVRYVAPGFNENWTSFGTMVRDSNICKKS